ncbi:MAG: DUF2007 domain-containing protein [Alphaproteobacteria bacterium]|nr:DUF2007 domain-containing protein [Alphaproteobacteria bacterium]
MKEVIRSTDPVRLSYVTALLSDAGIETVQLDAFISAVEGSIGIFPRRLMVLDEDFDAAVALLKAAEEYW